MGNPAPKHQAALPGTPCKDPPTEQGHKPRGVEGGGKARGWHAITRVLGHRGHQRAHGTSFGRAAMENLCLCPAWDG
jgi:hypothetical protein